MFLRNFFIRHRMSDTLSCFQQQWYQLQQSGRPVEGGTKVPQQYLESQALREELKKLKDDLDKAIIVAEKAKGTYEKLLKERNYHKMHHQRVQQEKRKINSELEIMRSSHGGLEKKFQQMSDKLSHLSNEAMLIKIERDRLKTRAQIQRDQRDQQEQKTMNLTKQSATADAAAASSQTAKSSTGMATKTKWTAFPPNQRHNSNAELNNQPQSYKGTILFKTWRPHNMAVTGLSLHMRKPIIATASDDLSWKIMTVPQGELIMSGEGHSSWLSTAKFHPLTPHLLTASGDSLVKLWDLSNTTCLHTFKDHTQAVWDAQFHDTGDFFATASLDHLAKLFDVNVAKCRQSFRGHVDSVSALSFQPYSNILVTGSADKSVSLWDMRTALCVQTFYGHTNSVNDVCFNLIGDKVASCDSDGVLKVWDVRMVKQKTHIDCSKVVLNALSYDAAGQNIIVAMENGEIRIYNQVLQKLQLTLKGHQGAVNDIVVDYKSKVIYSCGADCTARVWQ